jgi:acyl-CoA reductase-like NAD-dependent aldehyde dehydrogenase
MPKPYDIEVEIDAIRDKIYKTTQKMSVRERVEYINTHAHEILKRQQELNRVAVHGNMGQKF